MDYFLYFIYNVFKKTYNYIPEDNIEVIEVIPINKIRFNPKLVKGLQKNIIEYIYIPDTTSSVIPSWTETDQKKLDSILNGIRYDNNIPVIDIKRVGGDEYSLENGMHRVIASIISNYSYIPAKIPQRYIPKKYVKK